MTNQEMLMAAIEFEEVSFAYDLFFLIREGILSPNDEYVELREKWNLVDAKVTNEYMAQNLLGFDVINLYAIRINASDFMIIMARKDEEARGYALNKLGTGNYRIQKVPHHKWLTEFYFSETKEYKSLLDLRRETVSFPTHLII